jgi:hypothetical protein
MMNLLLPKSNRKEFVIDPVEAVKFPNESYV